MNNNQRFVRKLEEQLQFLSSSCNLYDLGVLNEAFRISAALRVLFHKSTRSTPIISRLKMENWEMLSSAASHGDFKGYTKIRISLQSPTPVLALPKLGTEFFPLPLRKWWHEQVVYTFEERNYSRRDLILVAANKDGGAHVDEKLDKFYEDLASGMRSLGLDGKNLKYNGLPPFDLSKIQYCQNTHLAMIRQFGHEVLVSANHFGWLQRLVC